MKKWGLSAVIMILFVFFFVGCGEAIDFNAMATKYVKACQDQDMEALFNMNVCMQAWIAKIRTKSPKVMVNTEVRELFEREKSSLRVMNKLDLFVPTMKWRLLETVRKPGAYDNLYGRDFYTLYIEMTYDDKETAPTIPFIPAHLNGVLRGDRPVKRLVAAIDFSASKKQYMGLGNYGLEVLDKKGVVYWE